MNEHSTVERYAPLLGRLLMGGMFLVNAVGLIGAFPDVAQLMKHKGIPFDTPLLAVTIAVWLIGAFSIISGYRIRQISLLLIIVLIPVTVGIHAPWNAVQADIQNQLNHFLKNIAIIGGLLYMAAFGPGPLALRVDEKKRRRQRLAV